MYRKVKFYYIILFRFQWPIVMFCVKLGEGSGFLSTSSLRYMIELQIHVKCTQNKNISLNTVLSIDVLIYLFLLLTKEVIVKTIIDIKMKQFGTKWSAFGHTDRSVEVRNKKLDCFLFAGNGLLKRSTAHWYWAKLAGIEKRKSALP